MLHIRHDGNYKYAVIQLKTNGDKWSTWKFTSTYFKTVQELVEKAIRVGKKVYVILLKTENERSC